MHSFIALEVEAAALDDPADFVTGGDAVILPSFSAISFRNFNGIDLHTLIQKTLFEAIVYC